MNPYAGTYSYGTGWTRPFQAPVFGIDNPSNSYRINSRLNDKTAYWDLYDKSGKLISKQSSVMLPERVNGDIDAAYKAYIDYLRSIIPGSYISY